MAPIPEARRRALLSLAREAIRRAVSGEDPPAIPAVLAPLTEPRSAFVTLRDARGELRGCRGEVPARRALPECVRRVAVSSALDDPRFPPVSAGEVEELGIEISALTTPRPLRPEQVEIGRHGLLISAGWATGLLLPQVPEEHGWDREAFLDALCAKAGLPTGSWRREDSVLLGFEAEVWDEEGAA